MFAITSCWEQTLARVLSGALETKWMRKPGVSVIYTGIYSSRKEGGKGRKAACPSLPIGLFVSFWSWYRFFLGRWIPLLPRNEFISKWFYLSGALDPRNACKPRVLLGKKSNLFTVQVEQGKNGTRAVLFRSENVHHKGVQLEAEWVTLLGYFTIPLSPQDTGHIKYWKHDRKFCKDDVSGYPCLYWRANLLTALISTLRTHRKAIHMTKGHSLKSVFARMGAIGVSTLYKEGWSGAKTAGLGLPIDSALDHDATNWYDL